MIRSQVARAKMRRGIAAVELAVLAPFLAFLFVVTVDFARVFYYQATIQNCARNGAIYGSNLRSYQETGWVGSCTDITSATLVDGTTLNPPLAANQVQVATGKGSDGNDDVAVTVTYPFTTITQFPGFGTTVNLTATVKMRVAP